MIDVNVWWTKRHELTPQMGRRLLEELDTMRTSVLVSLNVNGPTGALDDAQRAKTQVVLASLDQKIQELQEILRK
jgi:hypothetical protein